MKSVMLRLFFVFGLVISLVVGCAPSTPVGGGKASTDSGSTTGQSTLEKPAADAPMDKGGESDAGAKPDVTVTVATPEDFQAVITKHEGSVILVDFWATWCAPCRAAFPEIIAMAEKHDNVILVTMNMDDPDNEESVLEVLQEFKATGPNLLSSLGGEDESFEAYKILGGSLPHYKIYDRTGKMAHAFVWDDLAEKQFTKKDIEVKLLEVLAVE